jgi:hypothetical protein
MLLFVCLYWHVSSVALHRMPQTPKNYWDLFLPTTEVEDDQWWLGSWLILRTVNLFTFIPERSALSFLKDQTISTYLDLVTKAGERHTR